MNKLDLEGVSVDLDDNVIIGNNLTVGGDQVASGSITAGSGTTAISLTDGALSCGLSSVIYLSGTIIADALPTSDPEVSGQFWNDNGTVKVSAG